MSRWRLARITGAVLVLGTLFCGCSLLALARPTRPWYDVEAEQAAWFEFETKILVVGGLLVLVGVALGVAGAIGEAKRLLLPPRLADPAAGARDEPPPGPAGSAGGEQGESSGAGLDAAAGDPGRPAADGPERES